MMAAGQPAPLCDHDQRNVKGLGLFKVQFLSVSLLKFPESLSDSLFEWSDHLIII